MKNLNNLIEKYKNSKNLIGSVAASNFFRADENFDDHLPKKISTSFFLPAAILDESMFLFTISLGGTDPFSGLNRMDAYIVAEEDGWYFTFPSGSDSTFESSKKINDEIDEKIFTLTIQADDSYATSSKAETCLNWKIQVSTQSSTVFETTLQLRDSETAEKYIQGLHVITSLFSNSCEILPFPEKITFDQISLTSFSNKTITPFWAISSLGQETPPCGLTANSQDSSNISFQWNRKKDNLPK